MKCLIYDCEDEKKTRGLCTKHYMIALSKVRRNHTSWQELFELGMVELPKGQVATKGEKLISFETEIANRRVKGPNWPN